MSVVAAIAVQELLPHPHSFLPFSFQAGWAEAGPPNKLLWSPGGMGLPPQGHL